jgi:hypothetical protein
MEAEGKVTLAITYNRMEVQILYFPQQFKKYVWEATGLPERRGTTYARRIFLRNELIFLSKQMEP